jgi:hypothetical protein
MGTERELHVEHEEEQNSEGPHVDLEPIERRLVARKYLRRHKLFSSQDRPSDISLLFAEAEVG